MRVFANRITGSIGGGALEWQAMQIAREMLNNHTAMAERHIPLGPDLGQCCGGSVTLHFSRDDSRDNTGAQRQKHPPLWIWGAGHVGRAIAATMAPLDDRDITLIDVDADRLPDPLPESVTPALAVDPLRLVPRAADGTDHIIVTYSHDLDLALCDALLRRDTGTVGLIGSATKWARFRRRLTAMGHNDGAICRITCPIGDPKLGKHPQAIAIGVAARLLSDKAQKTPGGTMT